MPSFNVSQIKVNFVIIFSRILSTPGLVRLNAYSGIAKCSYSYNSFLLIRNKYKNR